MTDHDCHEHFEHGSVEKDDAETIKWIGHCTESGRELVEVYDYTGTYDPDAGEWINRMLDETTHQLHDLLSQVISRGRAGEWREAVDAMGILEDRLHHLVVEGGRS
jgi:hypothetical protein